MDQRVTIAPCVGIFPAKIRETKILSSVLATVMLRPKR